MTDKYDAATVEALEPCPWNKEHELRVCQAFFGGGPAGYRVGCCHIDCHASGPLGITEDDARDKWNERKSLPTADNTLELECYDTGLLGNGGGGDVEWWQDYIRVELARAHEFYSDQLTALSHSERKD